MFPLYHLKFFRLTSVLLGMLALALPLTAHGMVAGRVAFVIGKVEATSTAGSPRALSKGSEINSGETISTAAGARAQIRFVDGGFISLQPNSLFRVDEFNYQKGGEGKGFFSLLKGGLRAITGAIGRVNRDEYRVATPVATIGIRGTGYSAELSDGLFVNVGEGAISLTNNAGLLLVTTGKAAFVASINTPPAFTTRHPRNPPAGLHHLRQIRQNLAEYASGDVRNADGSLNILPGLVSGPGYALSYVALDCASASVPCNMRGPGGLTDVSAAFNSSGQLQGYFSKTESGNLGTAAAVSFSKTDGIIGWGRWVGNTVGLPPVHPLNSGIFDYVTGLPTAAMPMLGTATYNLMGGTIPTATDGTSWVLTGGWLSADFSKSSLTVNLKVSSGLDSYDIFAQPVALTGAIFSANGLAVNKIGRAHV